MNISIYKKTYKPQTFELQCVSLHLFTFFCNPMHMQLFSKLYSRKKKSVPSVMFLFVFLRILQKGFNLFLKCRFNAICKNKCPQNN